MAVGEIIASVIVRMGIVMFRQSFMSWPQKTTAEVVKALLNEGGKMTYSVRVTLAAKVSVTAENEEAAKAAANELLEDADLGPLEDIDWDIDTVTRSW